MNFQRKIITLTLTQKCNLSCVYCYENHKSSKMMSFETAKKIVDKEMLLNDGYEEIEFDLFGGEPFLNFDLIKKVTDYVIHYDTDKKVLIFIVTNGTLLNDEIKQWLIENKKYVICGLSLDGTKKMNDLNRCNSFDMIDLNFFLEHYKEQTIKMTVSPLTLNSLSEGVLYLQNLGFKVSCNLAYNIDWSAVRNVSILESELMKLINYYIENPQIEPVNLIDMPIDNVAMNNKNVLIPFCGAGRSMKAYDVNGEFYPCQFFMPLSVGEEKAKVAQNMTFYQEYIPEDVWDEKCKNCVIKNICPTCLGSNYAASGNMFYHEDNFCKLTKITIKARSYFKAQQILHGQLKNLDDNEIKRLKKAISIIQRKLSI